MIFTYISAVNFSFFFRLSVRPQMLPVSTFLNQIYLNYFDAFCYEFLCSMNTHLISMSAQFLSKGFNDTSYSSIDCNDPLGALHLAFPEAAYGS